MREICTSGSVGGVGVFGCLPYPDLAVETRRRDKPPSDGIGCEPVSAPRLIVEISRPATG